MSRVVVIKLNLDQSDSKPNLSVYKNMLKTGLMELIDNTTAETAVRALIPGGRVGIKTNCLTGKLNSTPVNLAYGLAELLESSGFEKNDIIIWERTNRELERAGYKLNASSFGFRCLGTDTNGIGYSRDFYSYGAVNSLISRILTEQIDYNINLPILKDHSIAGLSAGLKNMYGAVNNPNKYHSNYCDPFAADVSNLEPIKNKQRLSIIDAVNVQYNGGPGYDSRYFERYGSLIISDDPIAADSVGLKIVEHLRSKNGLPTLEQAGRPVKYLESAQKIGLGTADFEKIDLKVIAMDEDGNQSSAELF